MDYTSVSGHYIKVVFHIVECFNLSTGTFRKCTYLYKTCFSLLFYLLKLEYILRTLERIALNQVLYLLLDLKFVKDRSHDL